MRGEGVAVPMPDSRLIDVPAAADYLDVTERWVRRTVAERRLPHVKVGRYVRFRTDDLDRYIARQRVPARGDAA
jgi:excisionase family DNA binding protein